MGVGLFQWGFQKSRIPKIRISSVDKLVSPVNISRIHKKKGKTLHIIPVFQPFTKDMEMSLRKNLLVKQLNI